uniref:Uncharacterized protein n=1 Tax=Rhizophora mucronata TaxID=61149 RepID=A0A2P2PZL6_RHIMU
MLIPHQQCSCCSRSVGVILWMEKEIHGLVARERSPGHEL